jgi:hypothetical protein
VDEELLRAPYGVSFPVGRIELELEWSEELVADRSELLPEVLPFAVLLPDELELLLKSDELEPLPDPVVLPVELEPVDEPAEPDEPDDCAEAVAAIRLMTQVASAHLRAPRWRKRWRWLFITLSP